MDIRVFLSTMNFVHLESRERCSFRLGQVKRLSRRKGGNPVTRADIVVGAGPEFPSWGQESVNDSDGGPVFLPRKNERLIVRVSESATTTDRPPSEVRELLLSSSVALAESLAPSKISF